MIAKLTLAIAHPHPPLKVIMSLQCSRFLVKSIRKIRTGVDPKGSVTYLLDQPMTSLPFVTWAAASPTDLISMFKDRALRFALKLENRFSVEEKQNGLAFTDATNATAIHGYKAAACHSSYIVLSHNLSALENFVKPKDLHVYNALLVLFQLTAFVQIKDDMADWLGVITPALADSITDHIHVLLDRVRPDAVSDGSCFEGTCS